MSESAITKAMRGTAWKMLDTVFSHYRIRRESREYLLNTITQVALEDMLQSGLVEWKKRLPKSGSLRFREERVEYEEGSDSTTGLREELSEEAFDALLDEIEGALDRYNLPEDERAMLFTALPCLGLRAIDDYLVWNGTPPFPEVIGGRS